jgi:hypothetical protein
MATKKKAKKKTPTKSKKSAAKKTSSAKKSANKKKPAIKAIKKKAVAKKAPKKKPTVKAKTAARKVIAATPSKQPKQAVRRKPQVVNRVDLEDEGLGPRSGGQSGDLQGLSGFEGPDSESVDELLEEGNSFEAEVVKGVEDAGNADEQEVHTHEVLEDDVPEEYLDEK